MSDESDWVSISKPKDEGEWVSVNALPKEEETNPVMSGIRGVTQGASAGFSDELAGLIEGGGRALGVEGAGGPIKDISLADDGPSLDWNTIRDAYTRARDKERGALKKDAQDNPATAMASNLAGSVVSPLNKVVGGMSAARQGLALGGAMGLGSSEADNVADMTKDALTGSAFGGVVGAGLDAASPYAEKAANWVGDKTKGLAEKIAYSSKGPMLRDVRSDFAKGRINEEGRYILDNLAQRNGTIETLAENAAARNLAAGDKLDDIYNQASAEFGPQLQKVGYDPMRDKQAILGEARKALGQSEGSTRALAKLETYLDEVAARHGDKPAQEAQAAFNKELDQYLPKFRQFLKDRKDYRGALGSAGDDLSQPVLPGIVDDLQRTSSETIPLELQGPERSIMQAEMPSINDAVQEEMFSLPRARHNMNQRTADLRTMSNRMDDAILGGEQMGIEGLESVPQVFSKGQVPSIGGEAGQTSMAFAPEAPIRPVRPGDIRNPMSPRQANEVKSAMDDVINYSRNPLSSEPVTEKAFSAARQAMSRKVDEGIESLGGDTLLQSLKDANKDFGMSRSVQRSAQDMVNRKASHKIIGLTDAITGAGALGYGGATGDWKTAGGIFAAKKGLEKYGAQNAALLTDRISKALMNSPQLSAIATKNPQAFQNLVQKMGKSLGIGGENEKKSFESAYGNDAIIQKTQGTKYSQVFQNAAKNGEQGVAAAHFVLQSRDENYRKLMNEGENEDR